MYLHIADLQRDAHMLPDIKVVAEKLLLNYPKNIDPLIRRWLGRNEQYAQA
jgi:ATP-dependent DNA helicase RecG